MARIIEFTYTTDRKPRRVLALFDEVHPGTGNRLLHALDLHGLSPRRVLWLRLRLFFGAEPASALPGCYRTYRIDRMEEKRAVPAELSPVRL